VRRMDWQEDSITACISTCRMIVRPLRGVLPGLCGLAMNLLCKHRQPGGEGAFKSASGQPIPGRTSASTVLSRLQESFNQATRSGIMAGR